MTKWMAGGALRVGAWVVVAGWLGGCVHHTSRVDVAATGRSGGEVVLTCTPKDAAVEVDGIRQGRCSDFTVPGKGLGLTKGMHKIIVEEKGFVPYITYAEPGGATLSLHVMLQPLKVDGGK